MGAHRPHILVAEDDPAMGSLLVDALGADGYRVTLVRDGAQLLACLAGTPADEPIDLVVTDVHMPRKSGLEALEELRTAPWRAPVLLITADGAVERMAARLGAIGTLNKPFELDDLRSVVAMLLRTSATIRAGSP